jgi:hypothetical protein
LSLVEAFPQDAIDERFDRFAENAARAFGIVAGEPLARGVARALFLQVGRVEQHHSRELLPANPPFTSRGMLPQ